MDVQAMLTNEWVLGGGVAAFGAVTVAAFAWVRRRWRVNGEVIAAADAVSLALGARPVT